MHPGARTHVGPPPRFLTSGPGLGGGGWAVGATRWGALRAERERGAAVERAIERGITFFDTAPTYGGGASESLLGRVLRPHLHRAVTATNNRCRGAPAGSR